MYNVADSVSGSELYFDGEQHMLEQFVSDVEGLKLTIVDRNQDEVEEQLNGGEI